jgi:uncharacterized low-complexity protein
MKKRIQKTSMLSGAIIAFVLVIFTVQASSANTVSNQKSNVSPETGTGIAQSVIFFNSFDGKCGGGTAKTEKKINTKAKAKTAESKCGEGKCGTATSKTEKSTSKKAKSGEGKCGKRNFAGAW